MTWLALSSCTDLSCPAQPCSTPLQLSAPPLPPRCRVVVVAVVFCGSLLQFASLNVSLKAASAGGHLCGGCGGHCQCHYNVAAHNVLFPDATAPSAPAIPPASPSAPPPLPPVAAATRRPQNSRMQLITATMRPCSDRKWPLSHVPLSVVLAMKSK